MLPFLAWAMQERGTHSWGASDGREIVKHLGPICLTWAGEQERFEAWDAGIFHTRAASVGAHDIPENAHPFAFDKPDGGRVIGIHNGTLSNWQELNTKYNRDFKVDSPHLWAHRAAGLPWTDIRGAANLAWWEVDPAGTRELLLAKINTAALHVIRTLDGGLVFASTLECLNKAATITGTFPEESFILSSEKVYRLTDESPIETGEAVTFGTWVSRGNPTHVWDGTGWRQERGGSHYPYQGYRGYAGGGGDGVCSRCSNRVSFTGDLICRRCLDGHLVDFIRVQRLTEEPPQSTALVVRGGVE